MVDVIRRIVGVIEEIVYVIENKLFSWFLYDFYNPLTLMIIDLNCM